MQVCGFEYWVSGSGLRVRGFVIRGFYRFVVSVWAFEDRGFRCSGFRVRVFKVRGFGYGVSRTGFGYGVPVFRFSGGSSFSRFRFSV